MKMMSWVLRKTVDIFRKLCKRFGKRHGGEKLQANPTKNMFYNVFLKFVYGFNFKTKEECMSDAFLYHETHRK